MLSAPHQQRGETARGVNTVPRGIQPGDYTFFLQVSEFYKREFLPTSLDLGHLRSRGKPQV